MDERIAEAAALLTKAADEIANGPMEALRGGFQLLDDMNDMMGHRAGRTERGQRMYDEWKNLQALQASLRVKARSLTG